jgi:hypothetical protein
LTNFLIQMFNLDIALSTFREDVNGDPQQARPSVALVIVRVEIQITGEEKRSDQPGCDLQTMRLPGSCQRAAARQDLSTASRARAWEWVFPCVGDQSDSQNLRLGNLSHVAAWRLVNLGIISA